MREAIAQIITEEIGVALFLGEVFPFDKVQDLQLLIIRETGVCDPLCNKVNIEIAGRFHPVHLRKVEGLNSVEIFLFNCQRLRVAMFADEECQQPELLHLLRCQIVGVVIDQKE